MNTLQKKVTLVKKMLTTLLSKHEYLVLIVIFAAILFSPALNNFFSSDDWFHLRLIQISSLGEFINFFNPVVNPQTATFYRPLPTQLFFFVFYRLFGLWAFPYYLFMLTAFLSTIVLFYSLLLRLGFKKTSVLIATFVFAISHTHFTRVNFLSAGQEIMMSFFVLCGLLVTDNKKNKVRTILKTAGFFILALLCKESAIVFPILVVVLDWIKTKRIHWMKLCVLGVIGAGYMCMRFFIFPTSMTSIDTYKLDFSPRQTANSLYFYGLWATGGAELIQDYFSGPLTVINRFYTDFDVRGPMMLATLAIAIAMLGLLFLRSKQKLLTLLPLVLFVITLGPVLFFPNHKFAIQMSMPMMCFAAFVALICKGRSKVVVALLLSLVLTLNLVSISLTSKTHYSVQRSRIAQTVYTYFLEQYPQHQDDTYFVFTNTNTPGSDISGWGSSKQVALSIGEDNFAKVFYHDSNAQTFYEDIPFTPPADKKPIYIDSALFLR